MLLDSALDTNLKIASWTRIKRFINQIIHNIELEELIDFWEIICWISFEPKTNKTILNSLSECISDIIQRSKTYSYDLANHIMNEFKYHLI